MTLFENSYAPNLLLVSTRLLHPTIFKIQKRNLAVFFFVVFAQKNGTKVPVLVLVTEALRSLTVEAIPLIQY